MTAWRAVPMVVLVVACKQPSSQAGRDWVRIAVEDCSRAPYDIDREVVVPLEHEVVGIPHVQRVIGVSEDCRGLIRVDVDGDVDQATAVIRDRIASSSDAHASVATQRQWDWLGGYRLHASRLSVSAVRDWHDRVGRLALMQLPGVTEVEACGGTTDNHIEVRLDSDRLALFGVTASDAVAAARRGATDGDIMRAAPDVTRVCALTVASRGESVVHIGDIATCKATAPPSGCRAFDSSGEIVTVAIYGHASARRSVNAALDRLAGDAPGIEVEQALTTKQLLLVARPEDIGPLMKQLPGAQARVAAPGWLPSDVVLDVPADRIAAVREQAQRNAMRIDEPDRNIVWLLRDDLDELLAAADAAAASTPVQAMRDHWVVVDKARLVRSGVSLSSEQQQELAQLINGGLPVTENLVFRVDGERDAEALVIAFVNGAPVRLADVARFESKLVPRTIWRVNGRAAIAVRPSPSALSGFAHDSNAMIGPLVHLQ